MKMRKNTLKLEKSRYYIIVGSLSELDLITKTAQTIEFENCAEYPQTTNTG